MGDILSWMLAMTKLTRIFLLSFLGLAAGWLPATGQSKGNAKAGADSGGSSLVERGKYIVENVAMCEQCHTRRDENGNPERARWLMGGPTQLRASYPSPNWAIIEPKIGGGPPGTEADFIKLLTTGIARTGVPPKPPMPPFRMTRADAEAVLAYLKSLPH
jgi:mono/diheme cytochrome c family protein